MEWLTNPEIWIALLTLTSLEIVLGIDNVIFHLDSGGQVACRSAGQGQANRLASWQC